MKNSQSFVMASCLLVSLAFGTPGARADQLYVLDAGDEKIRVFDTAKGPMSKGSTFATDVLAPEQMVFDKNTNLFVTFQAEGEPDGYICEFAPDGTRITNTINNGPDGITVGPGNTIWVTYPENGNIAPLYGSSFVGGLEPLALAFDFHSNLFEADYSGQINMFSNIAGVLSSSIINFATVPGIPYSLAFDAGGDLFVTCGSFIYQFTNSATGLSSARKTFNSTVGPWALAFDSLGDLFASCSDGSLYEFTNTPSGLSTDPILFETLDNPTDLAFAPSEEPTLTALLAGTNMTISWPSPGFGWTFPWLWPSTGWTLQHHGNLANENWNSFSATITSNSLLNTATIPPTAAQNYFRLVHP